MVYYAPGPPEGLPQIPSAVLDSYTVITWPMLHPAAAAGVSPRVSAPSDALKTIEASFLRVGGTPQLGLTAGQRLGLEPTSALAALQQETRARAIFFNALAGDVRDTKRVRLTDFARGGAIQTMKDARADFGRHTIA
jgi:hypothetical protein